MSFAPVRHITVRYRGKGPCRIPVYERRRPSARLWRIVQALERRGETLARIARLLGISQQRAEDLRGWNALWGDAFREAAE